MQKSRREVLWSGRICTNGRENSPRTFIFLIRRLMGDAKRQTKWLKSLFDMSLGVRYISLLVTKGFAVADQYAGEADKLHDMFILEDLRDKKKERAEATNINVIDSHTEMLNINAANLERKYKTRRTMFKSLFKCLNKLRNSNGRCAIYLQNKRNL